MRWVHNTRYAAVMAAVLLSFGYTSRSADLGRQIEGPFSYQNLSIYIVHGSPSGPHDGLVTLDEALAKKYVTVFETGDVDELAIENHSDFPVYVQSGSIVKGGQQDRVIRDDLLLAAKSGKLPLSSFCVEAGRWSGRADADHDRFESSTNFLPTTDLKVAAKVSQSQTGVWDNVAKFQTKIAPKVRGGRSTDVAYSTSLPMTMEKNEVKEAMQSPVDSILKRIRLSSDAVGLVVVINNEIVSADLYDSPRLFQKLYRKLIEAASAEALSLSSVNVKGEIPTISVVQAWLDSTPISLPNIRRIDGGIITKVYTFKDKVNFETYVEGDLVNWIHKNVLKTK
ncbi:MAG: hypothetical protein IPH75_15235 [bacterium]|nr:hypothetical protein [bacterium]